MQAVSFLTYNLLKTPVYPTNASFSALSLPASTHPTRHIPRRYLLLSHTCIAALEANPQRISLYFTPCPYSFSSFLATILYLQHRTSLLGSGVQAGTHGDLTRKGKIIINHQYHIPKISRSREFTRLFRLLILYLSILCFIAQQARFLSIYSSTIYAPLSAFFGFSRKKNTRVELVVWGF